MALKVIESVASGVLGFYSLDACARFPSGRKVFEGDDTRVVHTLGPLLLAGLIDKLAVPRLIPGHPPRPHSVFLKLFVDVGDGAVLREGDELFAARERLHLVECGVVAGVVVGVVIDVNRSDVVVGLARIPILIIGRAGIPYPDDIMNALHADHLVEDQLVEFDVRLCTAGSPPEPGTAGLMERTEDAGDASLLKSEEIVGHGIDVADDVGVEAGGGVPTAISIHGIGDPHGTSVFVVDLTIEFASLTAGVAPMPGEGRDAAATPGILRQSDGGIGIFFIP